MSVVQQHNAAKLQSLIHPEQTMTTFKAQRVFERQPDHFVSTDTAALASHMSLCASKRSRFFSFHAALEQIHSIVFSRKVTAALLVVLVMALMGIV